MSVHPDSRNTGRLRPRYVELDRITDKDRLLWFDPRESQRFMKNSGVRLCHAEFFGDKDEVNQAVDTEELEFGSLYLSWPVRHDPNWTSCPRIVTCYGDSHRREHHLGFWKQPQAMESIFSIPVSGERSRVFVASPESSEQLIEVIGAVRVHLDRLSDHPVEIDWFS